MNRILLNISLLNEFGLDYLRGLLNDPTLNLEDLKEHLANLKDCELMINYNENANPFSLNILKNIDEAFLTYHNFSLSYDHIEPEKENKIILDVLQLKERKHAYLKELFDFPDYYGGNLDALYDCLSELDDLEIIVINMEEIDDFSLKILDVFDDVEEEFGNIKLSYEYDENDML